MALSCITLSITPLCEILCFLVLLLVLLLAAAAAVVVVVVVAVSEGNH